jgi:acetyltransferase-like isoleucine patch superfamily enzyme
VSVATGARRRARLALNRRVVERRADVTVDPLAFLGRTIVSGRGARGALTLGPRSVVQDGVVLQIADGGRITIGPDVTIRRGAVLNVRGHLELRGRNLVSWYSVVHGAGSVVFEEMAGTGEGVTVVDSTHFHGDPGAGAGAEHWYHNHRLAPVVIGRNTWLAAKSTVTAGVVLGEDTTVAAHAVVLAGEHRPKALLVGAPASER